MFQFDLVLQGFDEQSIYGQCDSTVSLNQFLASAKEEMCQRLYRCQLNQQTTCEPLVDPMDFYRFVCSHHGVVLENTRSGHYQIFCREFHPSRFLHNDLL